MIIHLTTPRNATTLAQFEGEIARAAGVDFRRMTYPEAVRAGIDGLPRATWLISDFDLLDPKPTLVVSRLWRQLAERGDRLLNHPTRSMRRYELLRTLHERGINEFDVYLATDPRRPRRYPVFPRWTHAHSGPLDGLIPDAASLERYLDRCLAAGRPRDSLLIVEHCDLREPNGLVREYGAFRIGDRIVPEHLWFSTDWAVKMDTAWELGPADVEHAALLAEELRYVDGNPHEAELMRLFQLARIEYGRMDYSLKDGRIQVWEINGNPLVTFVWRMRPVRDPTPLTDRLRQRFGAAMSAIDRG